jgi:hypothetical protein
VSLLNGRAAGAARWTKQLSESIIVGLQNQIRLDRLAREQPRGETPIFTLDIAADDPEDGMCIAAVDWEPEGGAGFRRRELQRT